MKYGHSALVVASAVLAGCSGGGTALPGAQTAPAPAAAAPNASTKGGAAAFTIVVPHATTAKPSRKPRYVSVSTRSLVVTLKSVGGAPVSSPIPYALNVNGVNSGSCATPNGGSTTCTLVVPATGGNDVFTVSTYDAQQTSANPSAPVGNLLSTQTATVTILANMANAVSVPITLDGVVASLSLTLGTTAGFYWYGSQQVTVALLPKDADGNLIVGAAGFRDASGNPLTITLSNSDTSGSTTFSGTTLTAAAIANVAMTYTGGPLPTGGAVFTASAPGITSSSATYTSSVASGTMFVGTVSGTEVYDSTGARKSIINAGTIAYGVALDSDGTLYQSQYASGKVLKLAPGATSGTYLGGVFHPWSLAVDVSSHTLYVAQDSGPAIFDSSGNRTVAHLPSSSTYILNKGVAVDPATGILVATDASAPAIYAYKNGPTNTPTALPIGNMTTPMVPAFGAAGATLYTTLPAGLFVPDYSGLIEEITNPLGSSPAGPSIVASAAPQMTQLYVTQTAPIELYGVSAQIKWAVNFSTSNPTHTLSTPFQMLISP